MKRHLECIFDFCGNYNSEGIWADLWEDESGEKFVSFGGGWVSYLPSFKKQTKQKVTVVAGQVIFEGPEIEEIYKKFSYPNFFSLKEKGLKAAIKDLEENSDCGKAIAFIEKRLTKTPYETPKV